LSSVTRSINFQAVPVRMPYNLNEFNFRISTEGIECPLNFIFRKMRCLVNKYLAWHPPVVAVLIKMETLRQNGLHFLIAEIGIALPICRKLPCIVSNKFKAGSIWIKDLTATCRVFLPIRMFLNSVT